MQYGFIKTAAGSPRLTVADTEANAAAIREMILRADRESVNLLALPELCLTGYTCGDLFYSETLLGAARNALIAIAAATKNLFPVAVIGLPLRVNGKLYNCAAAVHDGRILGVVPKKYLPNYGEFYEMRQFTPAKDPTRPSVLRLGDQEVPFSDRLLFECAEKPEFTFGIEICEDLWTPDPPSRQLCQAGATVIVNPSASDEVIGKMDYRRLLVSSTSARLLCGYVYSSADSGESTQDMVFAQHKMIAESGAILAENPPFGDSDLIMTELDVDRLMIERHRTTSYSPIDAFSGGYARVSFSQSMRETPLTRAYPRFPFVPASDRKLAERAEEILHIQSWGLKKRVEHAHAKSLVVGVSGGLDSALALLVAVRTLSNTASGQVSDKEKIMLETYVQTAYFDRILRRANRRLMVMTGGQYELKRSGAGGKRSQSGLDLDVIDHINSTARQVQSLSGGEAFKASLALALGLSDEIQSASGGVKLDTMFVDEGFGSLDGESLSQAMRALGDLAESHRLVGIISHVAELKERIDRQIIVTKEKTGGSSVKIIGD